LLKWNQVQHSYFDHNATTPVAPEVLETLISCLDQVYGNASSIHHFGQAAKRRLEAARRQVAALIHADSSEVVFTCGGTEADNLAVLGAVRAAPGPPQGATKHVVTSAIEHPAVLSACAQLEREGIAVTRVRVGATGVVNPDDVRAALRPETVLISVMHANNELGTIQPIVEIGRIAREAAVPLHVDGVQALGKIPVDVTAREPAWRRSRSAGTRSGSGGRARKTCRERWLWAPRPNWPAAFWRPSPNASPGCATASKTRCWAASPAPASTARVGAASPTPATFNSMAWMGRRW
jgi:cysteine sulfinate desulfinase/cysteine desulfurase-like protein